MWQDVSSCLLRVWPWLAGPIVDAVTLVERRGVMVLSWRRGLMPDENKRRRRLPGPMDRHGVLPIRCWGGLPSQRSGARQGDSQTQKRAGSGTQQFPNKRQRPLSGAGRAQVRLGVREWREGKVRAMH